MLNLDLDFCRVTALLRRSPGIQQPGSVMLQLVKLLLPSLKKALKYNQKEEILDAPPHPFSNMNQGPRGDHLQIYPFFIPFARYCMRPK